MTPKDWTFTDIINNSYKDIYHFLWFFGNKTDKEIPNFKKYFDNFVESSNEKIAIICLIFGISNIYEYTEDHIVSDIGFVKIFEDKYKIEDLFEISYKDGVFKWEENLNQWELNLNNLRSSKITIKNNWTNEPKDIVIRTLYGEFILEGFLHNDRFILNITKELIEKDDAFDIWDMETQAYQIIRKGTTEIYPLVILSQME